MSTQPSAVAVLAGLDQARVWMEAFYRRLHQQPELSHQEQKTPPRSLTGSRARATRSRRVLGVPA